jgi:TolB protein
MMVQRLLLLVVVLGYCQTDVADEPKNALQTVAKSEPLIGFTELQTNLPGGRHANVRTMRAVIAQADGSNRRLIGQDLITDENTWTQFAGWSPDGRQAIVARGWQDPENAAWEEEHRSFRMEPGKWLLDAFLIDIDSGNSINVTAVDRVSHYNGGLFFTPDRQEIGFTALIDGISKPFMMTCDGNDKRDVSGEKAGFAYGFSTSPDGALISYHENYQIYIANKDGSNKRHIATGSPFNFGPSWSPDGQWLLFLSGEHGHSNPHIVRRDGTDLRKLVDLNGYQGWILFLDVDDFHQGSSDIPVWSHEGQHIFFTAKVDSNVELFQSDLQGKMEQLTRTAPGTLHYHPLPSTDGKWLLYGSKREGTRQLVKRDLAHQTELVITLQKPGTAAMWPHWQPVK